ncbi:hypothetical protein GCM10009801_10150 [Streptomyces albiaxialis]|uniref:Uncharacterized protein n=1 Tax=Streptomyces albiaxialis TaxID=329523 RepID=A0ABN2VL08_9ACTN
MPAWVESAGGPLVVVPRAALPSWSGVNGNGTETDYDRACQVDGFAETVETGPHRTYQALVLGGEPAATHFLPVAPGGGVFVRRHAAPSDEDVLDSVESALDTAVWGSERTWTLPDDGVVVFDAAVPGDELDRLEPHEHLRVDLPEGQYEVRAAYVESAPDTWMSLIRVTRQGLADIVGAAWNRLLRDAAEREGPYAEPYAEMVRTAYAHPRLRPLYPWTGMSELHFSRCTELRWTWDIPYIGPAKGGGYRVSGPLRTQEVGFARSAEEAVAMVVDRLPPRSDHAFRGTPQELAAYERTHPGTTDETPQGP